MHTPNNMSSVPQAIWASNCASKSIFVHICRLERNDLLGLFSSGILSVPADAVRNANTVAAERGLGLNSSVYLYAGRAYPGPIGSLACLIALSGWAEIDRTFVSPFDTGGLFHDKLKLDWRSIDSSQESYLVSHSADFADFTSYFGGFLTSYFESAEDYWVCPCKPIDNTEFDETDDWRNWTFEVRQADATIIKDANWHMDYEAHSHYLDFVFDGEIDPIPPDKIRMSVVAFVSADEHAKSVMTS